MRYWFVRSPFKTRKWEDILISGVFKLYGIRNYAARKNISMMLKGDMALWYSSSSGKKVYGVMKVKEPAFPDNTTDANWLAVNFIPQSTFIVPIDLKDIKKNDVLITSNISKQQRISVIELVKKEYNEIINLGNRGVSTVDLVGIDE